MENEIYLWSIPNFLLINWIIVLVIFQAEMPDIFCFWIKCEDLKIFIVIYDRKLNVCGFKSDSKMIQANFRDQVIHRIENNYHINQ